MKPLLLILGLAALACLAGDEPVLQPTRTTGGPWQLISLPATWWTDRSGSASPVHLVFKLNTDTGETLLFHNALPVKGRATPAFRAVDNVVEVTPDSPLQVDLDSNAK